uniref:CSD domain-containing protein n=1 Tax=viral metagenome TaxID=1070528 RepID=A0A6C0JGF2_9ZZZZ
MSSTQETIADTQSSRLLGQVKWFNNKAGYGFITVSDGEQAGKDIFIHYSTIRVTNSQYKYLVQGEYVEFTLTKSTGEVHEFQASDVSGIKGGSLMCETRRVSRAAPSSSEGGEGDGQDKPRTYRKYPNNNGGSSRPKEDAGEFTTVRRKKPQVARRPAPGPKSVPTESA